MAAGTLTWKGFCCTWGTLLKKTPPGMPVALALLLVELTMFAPAAPACLAISTVASACSALIYT